MKYITLIFLSVGIFLGLPACSQKITYPADNLPDERIVFGRGGGFTGAYTDFIILKNGQVFKQNTLTKTTDELTSIKKRTAKKLFARVKKATETTIEQPGNMTYSLRYQNTDVHQFVNWGSPTYKVAADVQSLYDELVAIINPAVVK